MEVPTSPSVPWMTNNRYAQIVAQSSPFSFNLSMLPAPMQPRGRELVMKTNNKPFDDLIDFKSHLWIAVIAHLIKVILFFLPPLIVGFVYQSQCQIQEWIPRFLIVLGLEEIAVTFLLYLISYILMFILRKRTIPERDKAVKIVSNVRSAFDGLFIIGWFIAGSVWTFGVKSQVQFDDVHKSNYCHPIPYWFAFVYCVLFYLLMILSVFIAVRIAKVQTRLRKDMEARYPIQVIIKY